MKPNRILLISPSEALYAQVEEFLTEGWGDHYLITRIDSSEGTIPRGDIALLDQNALPSGGLDFLAKSSFELSPLPLILLMNEEPENEEAFKTVKSLTADYLIKGRLTSTGLHNTIRYALETTRLKLRIEQERQRYASLFYNAVEPAFFLDGDLFVSVVNDAFLETFKLDKKQALDVDFLTFVEKKADRHQLKADLSTLSSGNIDVQICFKSKSTRVSFLGHLKISPIMESATFDEDGSGKASAYHGTLTNISYQERLRAVKKKSEKIAVTYRLARTMAHEIRNPLTNVNLAVDQLKEETAGSGDLTMYFDIIQRCTMRIDRILSQLLSSSEKQVFKKTTFDVVALFRTVEKDIKDRSQLEDVRLTSEYEISEAHLEGDSEKLRIAFTNLFTNALESMDKEEKVISCQVRLDANFLCFEVRDNGSGMDQTQLESLFDPFYTNKANGVGLGLTSTQTIISEHQGEIEVESEKGVGSIFSVYLPINTAYPKSNQEV